MVSFHERILPTSAGGRTRDLLVSSRTRIQLSHRGRLIPWYINLSNITKTCLYNFDPLKPHFYIVKLGFIGVCITFHISVQNIYCGYSLEPPRRGGSNEYPQSMVWTEIWKISEKFLLENFHFLVVKFSVYLNRHVFVMKMNLIPWYMNHSRETNEFQVLNH